MSRYIYGPEEGDLLYLQDWHRSEYVLNGHLDLTVTPRHNNTTGFSHDPDDDGYVHLNDDIIGILYDMGFYGVFCCGYIQSDAHLITALLERWRMETHTFHLPIGEATITLEDVAVLWGLPIRGDPIIGIDAPPQPYQSWRDCCGDMLGFLPRGEDLTGSRIKMIALRRHIVEDPLDEDSLEEEIMQHARCAALLLMGAYMFPDTSGNKVSLIYLRHMRTVEQCRSCSWGSAVLAFLYRELCGASNSCNHNQNIGGALQLLQMWAWTRISSIRPSRGEQRMPFSVKDLCWVAGAAADEVSFQQAFNRIQSISAEAADYLMSIGLEKWTLAHDGGHRFGTTTTNHVEVHNGVLKGARRLPICGIVEMTYVKLTCYFNDKLQLARQLTSHGHAFTPYADSIYRENAMHAASNIVHMVNRDDLSANVMTVGEQGRVSRFCVTLSTRECSCGSWKKSGIPCAHAIQVCRHVNEPASHYMPWYYEIDHFMETYSGKFYPIWSKEYWPSAGFELVHDPTMKERRRRGRDRTTRLLNEMDQAGPSRSR